MSAVTARLEARISTQLHSMLKRAAEIEGRTITDFVIAAVSDAARSAVDRSNIIRLSAADQQAFADSILHPPKPNAAMKRAFARRRKLLRDA